MRTLLGIDIGTSSIKAMLLNIETGAVVSSKIEYDVMIPDTGYAEQNPETWWNGLVEILNRMHAGEETKEAFENIAGIGFSGQMHGLVCVDSMGRSVRPAILWLDQRTRDEVSTINEKLAGSGERERICNRIVTGFAFPSLLWMKKNEAENYKRIHKIFLPKDYIRYRITGTIGTDMTDASATGIYDVENRRWARKLIEKFEFKQSIFPECHESYENAGYVTEECSKLTGLKAGVPVVYGCGDQMAQSVGNGVYQEGRLISNFGTGGQVSAYMNRMTFDREMRTNTFCHAVNKGYSVFGATLNCGSALKWLCKSMYKFDERCYEIAEKLAEESPAGSKGIIYLPYLSGERSPIMNSDAKGVFFGLKLEHDKRHILRAGMEGIIYSLKDCLLTLQQMGIDSKEIIASGGGVANDLMLQMQADIFEKEIKVCNVSEQACLGACIIAGTGLGMFDIDSACDRYITCSDRTYLPIEENVKIYREQFEKYHRIYEKTKDLM